jgi:type I restriction enzyme S subunit
MEARYLAYLVGSRPLIEWATASADGTKMPRTSWEKLGEYRVDHLPSTAAQIDIADYLDSETARIDALIAKKQRSIYLLQARVEALVADVLDPLIATYGEIPLKFVASIDVSNVDKKTYDGQESVLLCNYTDVYYNRVINNAIEFMPATADPNQVRRLTLRAGDVLITKDSETADDIAVPALVGVDLPGVVLGYHLALLRPRQMKGDFLYWALRSRRCRDAFSLAASGVTRVGLRQDAMGRVPIPALDVNVQETVAQKLNREAEQMESMIRLLARQIELLREHRQALITAAVTGQIEIPGVAA